MLTYFLKQSPRLTELRLTNIHPTGFHYMSVVLVHKVGFFVFIPRCKIPSADNVLPLNTLSVYACCLLKQAYTLKILIISGLNAD